MRRPPSPKVQVLADELTAAKKEIARAQQSYDGVVVKLRQQLADEGMSPSELQLVTSILEAACES